MSDETLDRIMESVCQINVNLEGLRITLAGLVEDCSDHERRLRGIERWKHHLHPLQIAVIFVLGAVTTVAVERLLH